MSLKSQVTGQRQTDSHGMKHDKLAYNSVFTMYIQCALLSSANKLVYAVIVVRDGKVWFSPKRSGSGSQGV